MKRCILIFTVIFLLFSSIGSFTATAGEPASLNGSGTSTDPYRISSPDDLRTFAALVNAGQSFTDCDVVLTCDIDMNGVAMDMIGKHDYNSISSALTSSTVDTCGILYFTGRFDGKGHTISNLKIGASGTTVGVGLFAGLKKTGTAEAYIRDLGISGGTISGKGYIGSVVGVLQSGFVRNCWSSATVNLTNTYAGGIAGAVFYGTVSNCAFYGSVNDSGAISYPYLGGLVGQLKNSGQLKESFAHYSSITNGKTTTSWGILTGTADKKDGVYTVYDCYYVAPEANVQSDVTGSTQVSAADVASGKFVYETFGGAWGQVLGTDINPYPGKSPVVVCVKTVDGSGTVTGVEYRNTTTDHLLSVGSSDNYSTFMQKKVDGSALRMVVVAKEGVSFTESDSCQVSVTSGGITKSVSFTGEKLLVCDEIEADGEFYYAGYGCVVFGVVICDIPAGVLDSAGVEFTVNDTYRVSADFTE